jgi:hypothetical protein
MHLSFSIVYRKFVQSLGFSYLNVDSVLFVWDQILLKPEPMAHDMNYAFVAMLLAAREELILSNKFSEFVELVYMKGKAISIDAYIAKYVRVVAGTEFYTQRWQYEEIPVEAIKLDKVNLGPTIGKGGQEGPGGAQLSPNEDRLIEDNMDRILQENVLPEDQDRIPAGEGMLLDPSLLKDLDNEAAMNTGKVTQSSKKGKKVRIEEDPLMGDYKSTKNKKVESKGSSKPSEDILSDMPKVLKKTKKSEKGVASNKDGDKKASSNRTFSLPQSDSMVDQSSKKKTEKTSKKSSKASKGEEEQEEQISSPKTSKSKTKKSSEKDPKTSKSKDKSSKKDVESESKVSKSKEKAASKSKDKPSKEKATKKKTTKK